VLHRLGGSCQGHGADPMFRPSAGNLHILDIWEAGVWEKSLESRAWLLRERIRTLLYIVMELAWECKIKTHCEWRIHPYSPYMDDYGKECVLSHKVWKVCISTWPRPVANTLRFRGNLSKSYL